MTHKAHCVNYQSATCQQNRDKVEAQLKEEIRLGHYVTTQEDPLIISSLGAIPKADGNGIRLIHDCSRPEGKSINYFASPDKFQFDSVDSAIKHVTPYSWMAKLDIKAAYRHVGLSPSQFKVTGLKYRFRGDHEDTIMYDTRLPFGASESVGIFHRISKSIVRMVRRRTKRLNCQIFSYLDDYLVIGDSQKACQQALDLLIKILTDLGFSINWSKYSPPSQHIVFLGVQIDAVNGCISIPKEKMEQVMQCAEHWQNKVKATKKELQSLLGKLAWAAKCAKAARPAMRSIIRLQAGLRRASHRVRIPKAVKQDLAYFRMWCAKFNGVTFIPRSQPVAAVYTDSSDSAGAAFYQGDFTYMAWSADMPLISNASIYVKELSAVLLALIRWNCTWANRSIHLYTDNKATAYALRSGRTKCPLANEVLRDILWITAIQQINLSVSYISTKDNYVADALSRMHDVKFLALAIKLLADMDIHISNPGYNMLAHMSSNSLKFLFSRCP